MTQVKEYDFQRGGCYIVTEGNVGSDNVPFGRIRATLVKGNGLLKAGTLMGQVTATKEWQPLDMTANDGSEVVKGILFKEKNTGTTADEIEGVVHCAISTAPLKAHAGYLVVTKGLSSADIVTVLESLPENGIELTNVSDAKFDVGYQDAM